VRQLFSLRLLAAVVALAGLALLVNAIFVDDDELQAVVAPQIPVRIIDLIEPSLAQLPSDDFDVTDDGVTEGYLDLVLEDGRTLRIAPGTPGQVSCDEMDQLNRCAVFADVLGDAVIWFTILPQGPRRTAELPPIVDLEDGLAIFTNGWPIPYPAVIERECEGEDIVSFQDFLKRHGRGSVTIVDLETKQVKSVRCAADARAATSPTTTVPTTGDLPFGVPVDAPPASSADLIDEEVPPPSGAATP
jgi:hypothetical protein